MEFLMNLFGTMAFAAPPSTKEKKEEKKLILRKNDVTDFLKWGSIGFLGFGIYQLGMRVAKRNINPSCDLKDRADSLDCDPLIRECFINIQEYRDLNPWLFKTALQNVDHLLFLEHVLLTKKVFPTRNDKAISFSYFRMGIIRLNMFQLLVKEKLGNDHGVCVNIFVEKIYTQLQKHFLNILHLCSEFKPEFLISRAKKEVEQAMKSYKEGKSYQKKFNHFDREKNTAK